MKKKVLLLLAGALLASPVTFADNIIRMSVPIAEGVLTWQRISDQESAWKDVGAVNSCSNWSPAANTVAIGQSFVQIASDCSQTHEKTVQGREQNIKTHEIRNVGAVRRITETYTTQSSRDAMGTNAGTWSSITSLVSGWTNEGAPTGCTNWSPSTDTVNAGVTFTQRATDCQQDQQQTVQAREQNDVTHEIRNVGSVQINHQSVIAASTRNATGTFAGTWQSIAPVISAWANVGTPGGCTNWTPNPITVTQGTSFTQTATDCTQLQEQTTQAREQNSVSGAIRNNGNPQVGQKTVTVTSTRNAVGTKTSNTDVYTLKGYNYGVYMYSTVLTAVSPSNSTMAAFNINGNNNNLEYYTGNTYPAAAVTSLKWEMMDDAGVVKYTTIHTSVAYTSGGYMGWKLTPEEAGAAGYYKNWRVSITH